MKTQETDIQILRNAMLFGLTRRAWSNRCKVGNEKLKTEETDEAGHVESRKVTRRVNATKRLIVCDEYDAVMTHLNEVYTWVINRSMLATGIGRGVNFVRRDMVETIINHVEESRRILMKELVPAFVAAYPKAKQDAKRPVNDGDESKGGLGSLYAESDYPTPDELAVCFDIEYRVFALSIPDELPTEIRNRENQKLKESFAKAQEEVLYALREGFAGIVSHAIERLSVKTGEKAKVFVADSLVGNFLEFFDTFRAKNLMDDEALEDVVGQAQEIVSQFAPNIQNIKTSTALRNHVAAQLGSVKETLDSLLKDKPIRKFQFD